MTQAAIGIAGVLLLGTILWDAFQTMLVPRRIGRRFRLTNLFYSLAWRAWREMARRAASIGASPFPDADCAGVEWTVLCACNSTIQTGARRSTLVRKFCQSGACVYQTDR